MPTVRQIIAQTAREFRITTAELTGSSREYRVSHPRAIAVLLARQLTKASFAQIGRELSGRHYSTIISLDRRAHDLIDTFPEYFDRVQRIREALRNQP